MWIARTPFFAMQASCRGNQHKLNESNLVTWIREIQLLLLMLVLKCAFVCGRWGDFGFQLFCFLSVLIEESWICFSFLGPIKGSGSLPSPWFCSGSLGTLQHCSTTWEYCIGVLSWCGTKGENMIFLEVLGMTAMTQSRHSLMDVQQINLVELVYFILFYFILGVFCLCLFVFLLYCWCCLK